MAQPSPVVGLSRSLLSRASRRSAVLGAVAATLGAASLPALTGCQTLPYVANAVVSLCAPLLTAILDHPVDTLPPTYSLCEQHVWRARGEEIRFCLHCSTVPTDPLYVQLNCEGMFYPLKLRPPTERAPRDRARTSTSDGIHLSKMDCDEYLLAIAEARYDAVTGAGEATMVLPNARVLPGTGGYPTLEIRVDGVPTEPDGRTGVDASTAVHLAGDFDEVAHYAAELGVRSVEFRDGKDAWTVDVNHEFSAIAIFRNGRFVEARFLFAPGTGISGA
jgi:hypothetical protein